MKSILNFIEEEDLSNGNNCGKDNNNNNDKDKSIKISKHESIYSDETFTKQPIHDNYSAKVNTSYQKSLKESGLIFSDQKLIEKQDKVITFMLKKFGETLFSKKSIMDISLPVNIFDKRSLLEM